MDDVIAVMDAVGLERPAIFGVAQGGALAALLAASYPRRVSALILYAAYARLMRDEDYPWGRDPPGGIDALRRTLSPGGAPVRSWSA